MAAFDVVLEDLYRFLKSKWWGIPLVAGAVSAVVVFAVWNSLPNATKEELIGQLRPPNAPLPSPIDGRGTQEARVSLAPHPVALRANIRGEATADISNDGWMELRVYVSGAGEPCNKAGVYKNRHNPDRILSAVASCSVMLKPNTAYEFRVFADNKNADAVSAAVHVDYAR